MLLFFGINEKIKFMQSKLRIIFLALIFSVFIPIGASASNNLSGQPISAKAREIINKEKPFVDCLASGEVAIYFFYGRECPHCEREGKFLDILEKENKKIKIYRFEVWHDQANAKILMNIGKELDLEIKSIPFTIAGEKTISGYYDDKTTGEEIRTAINEVCQKSDTKIEDINVPFLGKISIKNLSLPIITLVIAALDGFNPCALWILLFLLSLLISMRDRKKMLVLGGTFILTSAIFYFLVLAAWLNFILFIGFVFWLRIIIGLVALYAGYYNLKEYLIKKNRNCEVAGEEKRKKTFSKLRDIVAHEKIWLALLGIIALAVSVNFLELVCSAGLPAVFTQILAISGLTSWQYYAYLILYVFIFVLNEIIILGLALMTLEMKVINTKVIRWVGIIGGIIMVILGVLLLFKPEWLMWG